MRTDYYPFGLTMNGISSKALAFGKENKKGYAGNEIQNKEFSDGSGLELYDFNARTYDQQIGRFIQIDPLTEEGGQESWSPYHYSYNNPVTFSDPDGKLPIIIPIIWAIMAAVSVETVATATVVATVATVTVAATAHAINNASNEPIGATTATGSSYSGGSPLLMGTSSFSSTTTTTQTTTTKTKSSTSSAKSSEPTNAGLGSFLNATRNSKPTTNNSANQSLPKPDKGKGSVSPNQRDPKRTYTKKEKAEMLEKQDGNCAGCGQKKTLEEVEGHHVKRHADGGKTTTDNGASVCKECHKEIHQ